MVGTDRATADRRDPGDPVGRWEILGRAVRRPGLVRLAGVFAAFRTAELGGWIAVTTVAFGRGGVDEASAVLVAQLAPAALVALTVGRMDARWGARRVLAGGLLAQAGGFLATAGALACGAPSLVVYAAAIWTSIAVVTTRPTLAAVLPAVVDDPAELTAANALVGWLDGAATLAGPAVTAVCLAAIDPAAPFVVFGVLVVGAAAVASRVRPASGAEGDRPLPIPTAGGPAVTGPGPDELLEDGPPASGRRDVRSVLAVIAAQAFLLGALDLLFVVVAIDVTGGPPSRAGWLNVAFGVGTVVGGGASLLLVGRRRLWPAVLTTGLVAAGAVALVGASTDPVASGACLVATGVGAASLLVASRTLLQRVCDLRTLCWAFALAEFAEMAMLLVGALTVPFLVSGLGPRWAPAGVAAIAILALAAAARPIAAAEARTSVPLDRMAQLRVVPFFALLPPPAIETLARQARPAHHAAGATVFGEGDPGDRYFVVTGGRVSVSIGGRPVRELGPGSGFGELALLHDVPRTATIVALDDTDLLSIDRTSFLVAVSGSPHPERSEYHWS